MNYTWTFTSSLLITVHSFIHSITGLPLKLKITRLDIMELISKNYDESQLPTNELWEGTITRLISLESAVRLVNYVNKFFQNDLPSQIKIKEF